MKKLVLIDSNAIIHRAYHALPPNMKNSKGELTNAVYGFTTTLIKVLEDLKPDYIAASFDVSKKTFRTEHYAEYKANRVKADQELYDQIPRVKELLEVLNIPSYELEGYEADDVIGTITSRIQNTDNSLQSYIVTGDKDLFQLINGNVFVYSLRRGLSDMVVVDGEYIKKEYNLDPADFIDLKALAGDPSDNIPGVPHIGIKTATDLLQKFDTLDNLYHEIELGIPIPAVIPTDLTAVSLAEEGAEESSEGKTATRSLDSSSLDDITRDDKTNITEAKINELAKSLNIKPRILRLLIDNKEQAFLSQRLATIHKEVPIDFDLEKSKWGEYNREKLADFFQEMGFKSLLKRFGVEKLLEVKTATAKKDQQLKLL